MVPVDEGCGGARLTSGTRSGLERRDWTHSWSAAPSCAAAEPTAPPAHHTKGPAPAHMGPAAPPPLPQKGGRGEAPSATLPCPTTCECDVGEFGEWSSVACALECTSKRQLSTPYGGEGAWCPTVCGAALGRTGADGHGPQICKSRIGGQDFCGVRVGKGAPHAQIQAYTQALC